MTKDVPLANDYPYGARLGYRRLRSNPHVRDLTSEVQVQPKDLIQALFAVDGISEPQPVPGIPGTFRDTSESLLRQVESDLENGCSKFLLFPVPDAGQQHSHQFSYEFATRQVESLKSRFGKDLWLALDVCLCSSTDHGHCGIMNAAGDHLLNVASTEALAQQALCFAQAGADCVAPSDMMDGRIASIRKILADHQHDQTIIMSYSAKFASAFYGPFRVACDSSPSKGENQLSDRTTYQMDPRRPSDAFNCSLRDWQEGADILMVKPSVFYLDVLKDLTTQISAPFAVYYVSGEHAMIECAAEKGLVDGPRAHQEAWLAMKRAGASMIISYAARYATQWLG